jgi:hypothetical protein
MSFQIEIIFCLFKKCCWAQWYCRLYFDDVSPIDISEEFFLSYDKDVLKIIQLCVGGLISYLHYLCLFVYSGVQHTLCCILVLFFFVLCTLCCQILWIVHSWLSLPYSLKFIQSRQMPDFLKSLCYWNLTLK